MAVDDDDDPWAFMPEEPAGRCADRAHASVPDLSFTAEDRNVAAAEGSGCDGVPGDGSREPGAGSRTREAEVAAVACSVLAVERDETRKVAIAQRLRVDSVRQCWNGRGFAAGYMARPRALQSALKKWQLEQRRRLQVHRAAAVRMGARGHGVRRRCPKHPHPVHLVHPCTGKERAFWSDLPRAERVLKLTAWRGVDSVSTRDLDIARVRSPVTPVVMPERAAHRVEGGAAVAIGGSANVAQAAAASVRRGLQPLRRDVDRQASAAAAADRSGATGALAIDSRRWVMQCC